MIRLNRQNPVTTLSMILVIVNSAQCNPILHQYSNFFDDNIKANQFSDKIDKVVCGIHFHCMISFPKNKKEKENLKSMNSACLIKQVPSGSLLLHMLTMELGDDEEDRSRLKWYWIQCTTWMSCCFWWLEVANAGLKDV